MTIPFMSLERMLFELNQYALETPEGISYSPRLLMEQDEHGVVTRIEVGVDVNNSTTSETRSVTLVPSTDTDEGAGHGNVFVYVDDEPITHVAWNFEEES